MLSLPTPTPAALAAAHTTVARFTAAATLSGAIPVPGASAAIVAENGAMIAVIAADLGTPITAATVLESLGFVSAVNVIGRTVFVEAARAMGWAAGPLGLAGVCALGATTAGLQTWLIGHVAIAIGKHGGASLSAAATRAVLNEATDAFAAWRASRATTRG